MHSIYNQRHRTDGYAKFWAMLLAVETIEKKTDHKHLSILETSYYCSIVQIMLH